MRRKNNQIHQQQNTGLQAFALPTVKALGQHFLRDESVVMRIVHAAEESLQRTGGEKVCVEIGPGPGILTQPLLSAGWNVLAIEKDRRAVEGLADVLGKKWPEAFAVQEQDVLEWKPDFGGKTKLCIGNLPYYISSPIFLWFCENYREFTHGIFMIQDEVADRLAAKPGSKDYGRLTARMQLFFDIQKLFVVGPKSFIPPPKVNSAVIRLVPKGFSFSSAAEDKAFGTFTTVLFSARRKMMRRVIADRLEQLEQKIPGKTQEFWEMLGRHGVMPETRPDTIPPEVILEMHRFFWGVRHSSEA